MAIANGAASWEIEYVDWPHKKWRGRLAKIDSAAAQELDARALYIMCEMGLFDKVDCGLLQLLRTEKAVGDPEASSI